MSKWYGKKKSKKPPHVIFMKSKPIDRGVLLRSLCDGETAIMLQMEIVESKAAMARKKYVYRPPSLPDRHSDNYAVFEKKSDVHKPHTAIGLRLCEPYFGTWRNIISDSAYSSYHTAMSFARHGLFHQGHVKTATTGFCRASLLEDPQDGATRVFESQYAHQDFQGAHKIIAIGHTHRNSTVTMIATTGSTQPVVDNSNNKHSTHDSKKQVPHPEAMANMFKYYNGVDHNNMLRQHILDVEERWLTQRWWIRFWATILGIIATDAYLAYSVEHGDAVPSGDEEDSKHELKAFIQLAVADCLVRYKDDPSLDDVHETVAHDAQHTTATGALPSSSGTHRSVCKNLYCNMNGGRYVTNIYYCTEYIHDFLKFLKFYLRLYVL